MRTEVTNVAANTTFFGAIGWASAEAMKWSIGAFRNARWTYFIKEPPIFNEMLAMDSIRTGVAVGLFILVDYAAKKALQKLMPNEANVPMVNITRIAASALTTGYAASVLGLTASAASGCAMIFASMAVYALLYRLAEAFNWGVYADTMEVRAV